MDQIIPLVQPPKLFIPKGTITLDKVVDPQIRLGIQGYPNTGKTWSALTFPFSIDLNMDRGMGAHIGRSDISEIPFHDAKFVEGYAKRQSPKHLPNVRDAIVNWLAENASQFDTSQTVIVDSLSQLQNSYHEQFETVYTDLGKLDKWAEWKNKIIYFRELFEWFKVMKCNLILITHESQDRDDAGDSNGKIRPLLSGGVKDEMESHFTDWFRQLVIAKPAKDDQKKFMDRYLLTESELQKWLASTDIECRCIYLWQTQSDDKFSAKCGSLVNAPKYIIAHYKSFLQYRRKQNNK